MRTDGRASFNASVFPPGSQGEPGPKAGTERLDRALMDTKTTGTSIAVTELAHAHLVAVRGELDIALGDRLLYLIGQLRSEAVIVNLGGLTFVDGAGIGALARAKRLLERHGHHLVVINARGLVRQVFEMRGEADLLAD